jgi:hypothetical protein
LLKKAWQKIVWIRYAMLSFRNSRDQCNSSYSDSVINTGGRDVNVFNEVFDRIVYL